jgi:hypothetical protein
MKKIGFIFYIIFFYGCVKQVLIVDKKTYNAIPLGTKKIVVSVTYSTDILFDNVLSQFQKDRCKQILLDREKGVLVFRKYLESTDSQLFMNVKIIKKNNGSMAIYSSDYGANLTDLIEFKLWNERAVNKLIEPVVFTKTPSNKVDHCFQYTLLHALNLKGETIFQN